MKQSISDRIKIIQATKTISSHSQRIHHLSSFALATMQSKSCTTLSNGLYTTDRVICSCIFFLAQFDGKHFRIAALVL